MAEPPHSWDLLTASLAVSDLTKPYATWAFLVVQGLVRDEPGDRETFQSFVNEETADPVIGPTAARRIALRLSEQNLVMLAAEREDPWGQIAAQRLQAIEAWTGGNRGKTHLDQIRAAGR